MNAKEHILRDIQKAFPEVRLPAESELLAWLDEAVPTMVRHWLISARTLKVCGGVSPDFAEIAAAHGFPVVTVSAPGHFYNVALTQEAALLIDLSAAQFEVQRAGLCDFDVDELEGPDYQHLLNVFERIERDPFSAVRIERIDPRGIGNYRTPTGSFPSFLDPVAKYKRNLRSPPPRQRNPLPRQSMSRPTVVLSYGLGVDSTAILLRWLLDPSSRDFELDDLLVITAMTGNEWPRSGQLVVDHILPLLREHHVRYVQVARKGPVQADGIEVLDDSRAPRKLFLAGSYTLADEMLEAGTVPQLGGERLCSMKAKGWPLDTFIESVTAGHQFRHAIGFEANEPGRAERDADIDTKKALKIQKGKIVMLPSRQGWYPLLEWGWDRKTCELFIKDLLGVDWPKSACYFCPFAMSSKASRKELVERWVAEPDLGILTLLMERVSVSLNPEQGIRGKERVSDEVRAYAPALLQRFEHFLDGRPYALYEVSRAFNPFVSKDGKARQNVARRVAKLAQGTRHEMESALQKLGKAERDRDGIPRVWVLRRQGTPRDREQLFVAAPDTVTTKTGPAFDTTWVAAAVAAGQELEPGAGKSQALHAASHARSIRSAMGSDALAFARAEREASPGAFWDEVVRRLKR